MSPAPLFIVTDVAPYPDGPAGVHGVLPQAAVALGELAGLSSLEAVPVGAVHEVEPDALARGGVLALFTIGETPWSGAQRGAITDAVRAGRLGILGVHAATDACLGWEEYGSLLGARFDGHPWTAPFDAEVLDPDHPATRHLGGRWSWHDEVYLFRDLRPDARVLLQVADDQLDMAVPGARRPACGFPLAWCFTEGEGRVLLHIARPFPRRLGDPRLPPPPPRRPGLGAGRGRLTAPSVLHLVDTVEVEPRHSADYLAAVRDLGVPVMTGAGASFVSCGTAAGTGERTSIQVVWGFADYEQWNDIRMRLVLDPRWYEYGARIGGLRTAGTRRFYAAAPFSPR